MLVLDIEFPKNKNVKQKLPKYIKNKILDVSLFLFKFSSFTIITFKNTHSIAILTPHLNNYLQI